MIVHIILFINCKNGFHLQYVHLGLSVYGSNKFLCVMKTVNVEAIQFAYGTLVT